MVLVEANVEASAKVAAAHAPHVAAPQPHHAVVTMTAKVEERGTTTATETTTVIAATVGTVARGTARAAQKIVTATAT